MKRFVVFADSMNLKLGTESTMDRALDMLKKRNKGHGNIVELTDSGEYYRAYGIKSSKVKRSYKLT